MQNYSYTFNAPKLPYFNWLKAALCGEIKVYVVKISYLCARNISNET